MGGLPSVKQKNSWALGTRGGGGTGEVPKARGAGGWLLLGE